MVFLRRVQSFIFKKKPRVVLENRRFHFARDMKLGSKGQLDTIIKIKDINRIQDEDFNEFREILVNIEQASILDTRGSRELDASNIEKAVK